MIKCVYKEFKLGQNIVKKGPRSTSVTGVTQLGSSNPRTRQQL